MVQTSSTCGVVEIGGNRLDVIFNEFSLSGGDLSEEAVKLKELLSGFGGVFELCRVRVHRCGETLH